MSAALFYRIASVLLVLFAAGHTAGFRQVDPKWGIGGTIQAMQTIHFNANGSDRTYWDFFVGFGLFVTLFMLLAAVVLRQMGGLPPQTLVQLRLVAWSFVLSFAVLVYLSWRYFFVLPMVFSSAILLCLVLAAWKVQTTKPF